MSVGSPLRCAPLLISCSLLVDLLVVFHVFVHFGQVSGEGCADSTISECHLLHLVVDVAGVLVAVLPMVLVSDVLGVVLNFIVAEVLELLDVEVVEGQVLIIQLRVVVLTDLAVNMLGDLGALFNSLLLLLVI